LQAEEEQQEVIATSGTITILSIQDSYAIEQQQWQHFNEDVHTFDSNDQKKCKVAFLNDQILTKNNSDHNESKQTNFELNCGHYDPKSNIERGVSKYLYFFCHVINAPLFFFINHLKSQKT
jgi:hypothetical protein